MTLTTIALYKTLVHDLREVSYYGGLVQSLIGEHDDPSKLPEMVAKIRSIELSPDDSPVDAACLMLLKSFLKKYSTSKEVSAQQEQAALAKFLSVNERLKLWELSPNTSGDEELIGAVKEQLYHFWHYHGQPLVTNPLRLFDEGRTGPGASIGARGSDFFTKMFDSPLSATTEGLFAYYKRWCDEDPNTKLAEELRTAKYGQGSLTNYNRLAFVPKDDSISRTIATEPALNMYCQLGLGSILERRLGTFFGIDLATQPLWNRDAALIGSMEERRSFVTIDLSSASDSLGVNLLRYLLPSGLFRLCESLRAPCGILPDGQVVEYSMMSTMGNGFTFPLQTIIFSAIVTAAIKSLGLTPQRPCQRRPQGLPTEWGVFGDDIICHSDVAPRVLRLLSMFGFQVNSDKTYIEGPFRESCGHDYFRGHDVRGFFLKEIPRTASSLYGIINGLISWSYKTGIYLPQVGNQLCQVVERNIGWAKAHFVPPNESSNAGIRVPLFVLEQLGYVPKKNKNRSYLYKALVASPKELRIGDGKITVPRGAKERVYNAPGLLLAFLRGTVRSGRISIRQTEVRFRVRGRITPSWDYVAPESDLLRRVGDRFQIWRLEIASGVFLSSLVKPN